MKSVHLFPGTSEGRWGTRLREQGRGRLWDLPKDTDHHWETRPEAKWSSGSKGYVLECWMAVLRRQEHANVSRDGQFRGEETVCGPELEQGMYMYPHIPPNTLYKHTGQS